MRILLICLALIFTGMFSSCSINFRFVDKYKVSVRAIEKKLIRLHSKDSEKFNSKVEQYIGEMQDNVRVAEKIKDSEQMKTNINALSKVTQTVDKIEPNILNSLASVGSIETIKPFIAKYKYYHLKIEAYTLCDEEEYGKAIEVVSSHNSTNSTAISNSNEVINYVLNIHADSIIAQYGEVNPYNLSKNVKAFMDLPIIDMSKYKYGNSDYKRFLEETRTEAFGRLLNYAESLIERDGFGDMLNLDKLYDAAEDIAVTYEELETVRKHRLNTIETCISELLKKIETAIDNHQFQDACDREKEILQCAPNYISRCKEEETKYYVQSAKNFNEKGKIMTKRGTDEKSLEFLSTSIESFIKAEELIESALKISPNHSEAKILKIEIRERNGYAHYEKGSVLLNIKSDADLAIEFLYKALDYIPQTSIWKNEITALINKIKDLIGRGKLLQAERFKEHEQCKEAYYRAKEAIEYLKDDTDAKTFMANVKECATTSVAFALVVNDNFPSLSINRESEIRSLLQSIVKKEKNDITIILSSDVLPIFTNRSDAIYAANRKRIDKLLIFEIESYQRYGGSDKEYDNYATIYKPYYVFVKNGCNGLFGTYDCYKEILDRAQCETVKYTKIIDNFSINVRVKKQWLNPATEESYFETSKYLSSSFKQETWYYPGTDKDGDPMYLYLRKYTGEGCRATHCLDMSYFKRERKSITHAGLACNTIVDYLD